MRKNILVLWLLAVIAIALTASDALAAGTMGDPIRLMRRPDINQGTIVFSYEGDLWIVPEEGGMARRLTVHLGEETDPKFSPDGNWIAFSGDFDESNGAIFVMPANGGAPQRLSFDISPSQPITWTHDGKNIVFSSRQESFSRFFTKLFIVPRDGGLPVEMEMGMASFASYAPDGKRIAYNRHPDLFWSWKRYKGTMNQDVWIYEFEGKKFTKITDYEGNDSWPMWTGDYIYFVSDREGSIANLFSYDLGTKTLKQLTQFKEHGVTWPSMSSDGTRIVFERDARLYVHDTETDVTKEVIVYAPAGNQINMISYINPLDYISSFHVSPEAKRIVFEARGDIYTAPAEHGDVRNLTESSGARDSDPAWSPDGRWITYVSDKSGDEEIYLIDQKGQGEEKQLTTNGHFKAGVTWSPKSDKLLYTTDDSKLYLLDVGSKESTLIAENEHREITSYSWAPDGTWFAYDFAVKNRNRDVYFYNIVEKTKHQITTDLGDDYEPTFTPDGKYLLMITDRIGGTPVMVRLSLVPEEEEPFEFEADEAVITGDEDQDNGGDEDNGEDEETDADENGGKKKGKMGMKGKKEKKKDVKVVIDFNNIEGRIRRVPKIFPNPRNIQATERYYYYLIMPRMIPMFGPSYDLYAFDTEDLKSTKVLSGIQAYGLSGDLKKIAYFDGNFHIINVGKKAAKKGATADADSKSSGKLDISSKMTMRLDRQAEWRQIFNEGWRVIKYHFYDPDLHGVDWDGVKKYYESLLPYVHTRRELNILMVEMVGELNASHQGVSGGDFGIEVPRTSIASLGARLVLDETTGYARFEKIYQGSHVSLRERSPLGSDFVKIKPGDYLLAIDGRELQPFENFNQYLVNKTKNKITISTNSKPTLKGAIETTFKPIVADMTLRYKDWVDGNQSFVDEKSGGRIGYMHLPDMMAKGWVEFREKFEKFRYKDALIIDVRYNGGGNIDERIIDYLERRPYHITKQRNQSVIERPAQGYYGDIVVLMNEFSFSDAEVFPSAVKERGLGTLIGIPTLGYVIAVSSHQLVDKGTIRKTHTGIWELSTGDMLEGKGAIPDIYVENTPESEQAGRDLQLEKAIEHLMEQLSKEESREYKPQMIKQ